MSALLASLALLAQPAEPEPYRALGASPLWGARIGDGRMVFETPGRDIVDVVAPAQEPTEIGVAFWTADFSISVEHANCTDPLTRRLFSDRVTVRVGETGYEGCGGRALSPELPTYGAASDEPFWWLEMADGRITFQIDNRAIIVPAIAPFLTGPRRSRFYRSAGLTVRIRARACELDDGRTYADSVTVTAGGQTVSGCGGVVVREAPDE